MDCLAESVVLQLLEGSLEERLAREVEAHMAGCADCRELVSVLARQSVVGAPDATLPASPGGSRVPGAIVGGRFRLGRIVGAGGMGEVWAAQHLVTRKMVALKFLRGAALPDRKRLYREARASSLVAHPNVLEIRDVLELDDGTPVLVMDLLIGRSLREHLARHGSLPLGDAAALLAPAVSAVGAAHARGIVHRDLKPDNIFLVDQPGGLVEVKVLDFGVAKLTATEGDAARTAALTQTGELVGTPYYMSPEQSFGEPDVDHRTDLWALGVILYECLAGRRPFEGTNLGQVLKGVTRGDYTRLDELRADLPKDVSEIVAQLLSVPRADRPSDLRPLHAVLARHGQITTASFGAAASVEWTAPSSIAAARPRYGWAWLVAALVLMGSAATVFWTTRARPVPAAVPAPNPVASIAVDLAVAAPPPDLAAPATPPRKTGHKPGRPAPTNESPARLPGGVFQEVPF